MGKGARLDRQERDALSEKVRNILKSIKILESSYITS